MTTGKTYEVIVSLEDGKGYSRLCYRDRTEWKTKRTAEKHAREFKASHLRDAWVSEA